MLVPMRRVRGYFGGGEAARDLLDLALVVGQVELHGVSL